MNKKIKFAQEFVDPILRKVKVSTRRLFDDKDLAVGDTIDLINKTTLEKFAEGKITAIEKISFSQLLKESDNAEKTYQDYKGYYGENIPADAEAKIIHFEIK